MDERCDGAISLSDIIYRHGNSYTKQRAYSEMHVSHFKLFYIEFRLLLLVSRSVESFGGCVVGRLIRIWVFGWHLIGSQKCNNFTSIADKTFLKKIMLKLDYFKGRMCFGIFQGDILTFMYKNIERPI
jgi:hypothetical protein